MTQTLLPIINGYLAARLDAKAASFVQAAQQEIAQGCVDTRFAALFALASRYSPRQALQPTPAESAALQAVSNGYHPARWKLLEAVRISLVLSRPDLLAADFGERFNTWFAYVDEGEACALYRALPLLPGPERFVWRAAEGCRTNMASIFTAVTCDSPFPARYFDELVWNQLVVKALFTGTSLQAVQGFNQRLSTSLALMVLDYVDERRSAGRDIPMDAWLCLGTYGSERATAAIEQELQAGEPRAQAGAILALARAQHVEHLQRLQHQYATGQLSGIFQQALSGGVDQAMFYQLLATLEV